MPDADAFVCMGKDFRAGLVGHNGKVASPEQAARLACAPQLVFVIGRRGEDVDGDDAMDYALGVTILNDLTEGDPPDDAPGFAPLGPEIVTMDELGDPFDIWLTCAVNGEERMRVNTGEQVSKLPAILEQYSALRPIEPGDLFSAGMAGGSATPGSGTQDPFLKPGDVVECTIEGVMTLRTTIVAAGAATA